MALTITLVPRIVLNVRDFVAEVLDERTRKNPRFPEMVADAERRRELGRVLAAKRQALGLSQTIVAAGMRTAPSVVSKLEAGADVRLSTYQRYLAQIREAFPPALAKAPRPRAKTTKSSSALKRASGRHPGSGSDAAST
jgi:hypothetical protein